MRLILASASPRRLALLGRIGVVPDAVCPPEVDETPHPDELPLDYARRIAAAKAAAIPSQAGTIVLAADTVVAVGRRILPKAETRDDARFCLSLLSGRRHRVHSAIAVRAEAGRVHERVSTSILAFKRLTDEEVAAYIEGGEWEGKAGGYAIQGKAESFVRWMSGSHSGVVGLPLFETRALLAAAGHPLG